MWSENGNRDAENSSTLWKIIKYRWYYKTSSLVHVKNAKVAWQERNLTLWVIFSLFENFLKWYYSVFLIFIKDQSDSGVGGRAALLAGEKAHICHKNHRKGLICSCLQPSIRPHARGNFFHLKNNFQFTCKVLSGVLSWTSLFWEVGCIVWDTPTHLPSG